MNQNRDSNHHAHDKVNGMSLDLSQMTAPHGITQQRHGSSAKHGGTVGRSHDKGGFFTQAHAGHSNDTTPDESGVHDGSYLNKTQMIPHNGVSDPSKANANNERANRINLHRSNR